MSNWRLIPLYEGTGAEQMAVDSWLLDQHVKGLQPPSLRFYTWRSPTLSLGYHQRQFPESWRSLYWQGQPIDLVRRPTGGRAVLHQGDLTYALVNSGLTGSRRDVYQQLCQFLIEGWRRLGIDLTFGSAERSYRHNPNCFGTATAADLVMDDGYKLIGSAQVYRNDCVLQHGSIRLHPSSELFEKVFGEKIPSPRLPKHLQGVGVTGIAQTLAEAASTTFNVCFQTRPLAPDERQSALTACLPTLEQPSALDQKR
ncbi:MAG: lipoate--protein ligase family protein [Phormidesmis sp.]